MSKKCIVPECGKDAVSLGMCMACYQRTRYWHDRPMKDKVKRINQIKVWESSLEMQLGNVRRMRRRKTG